MSADAFVNRMMVLYGPPNSADDEAFIAELRDMLSGYGKSVLDRAGSMIRDSHTSAFWPTLGVINAAVRKAAHDLAPRHVILAAEDHEPPTPEQVERAAALVAELKSFVALHAIADREPAPLADTSRPAFEKMQRESRNRYLHEMPRTLTARSRAMTGEGE
jgi:hypothetical protein